MIINSFLKDNKKLLFVILAVVLYFNQWVLCVPYMLFYDKQFYNVDLTAAQIITPGIDYDYNKHLNSFEDNRQTVLLIDKINDDSYGTIYGRLYNRKDVNVTCNNQAAIDYHFEIEGNYEVGKACLMAYRTQIFTTRSQVAIVSGLKKDKPEIIGIYYVITLIVKFSFIPAGIE